MTASASATAANPFAGGSDKAKSKADLDGLSQVQTEVIGSLKDVGARLTSLPAQATGALAKLTASFTAG